MQIGNMKIFRSNGKYEDGKTQKDITVTASTVAEFIKMLIPGAKKAKYVGVPYLGKAHQQMQQARDY